MQPPSKFTKVLGLDIGGANLKAATVDGLALTVPFALWRDPSLLAERLRFVVSQFSYDRLAVTMTGELCDCFATKRVGVDAILDGIAAAVASTPFEVWSTLGRFVQSAEARSDPLRVASANWHALATFAGRFAPEGSALLLDIGTTTTDIIPILNGLPTPLGWTDPERLASGELVYTGAKRTPVCAVLGPQVAAELFATMSDVYLLLEMQPEEPENCETADGRPTTRSNAHARLARMMCSDVEAFSYDAALDMARRAFVAQVQHIATHLQKVAQRLSETPGIVLLSGSGAHVGQFVLDRSGLGSVPVMALAQRLTPELSQAACAHAVGVLAAETNGFVPPSASRPPSK